MENEGHVWSDSTPRLKFPSPTVSTPRFHLPRFCHFIITSPVHVSAETFRMSINGE